jgi:5-methylcytosine-specific restriction endonuclease McrA
MKKSSVRPAEASAELSNLSDVDLVAELGRRASRERQATADVIRALIEFDTRRLYLGEGYSSLFAYCTSVLHYSEHGAFNRIEVARAAARWPQLLACLDNGSLHLAGARLLAPHLTAENIDMALEAARHKSKREIEEVAAGLAHRALLVAVAAEQYRLHLTVSRETRDKLRQIQSLLSHQLPDGNPAIIVDRALDLLLEQLQRQRHAATDRPQTARAPKRGTRHIPAAVKREVWTRDDGRCAFVGGQGRCGERNFLEYHHVVPHADGGPPTAANIELRCRAHNVYEAELHFGPEVIDAVRARELSVRHDLVAQIRGGPIVAGKNASGGSSSRDKFERAIRRRAHGHKKVT